MVAVTLSALALAACSSGGYGGSSEPPCSYSFREQGFLSAAANTISGEYTRCTNHLRAQLADLQTANVKAKRNAEEMEALARSTSQDQRRAANNLAQLNRDSERAVNSLNELRNKKDVDLARLNDLVQQQQALELKKQEASAAAINGDVAGLEAEIAALQRQQDTLQAAIDTALAS